MRYSLAEYKLTLTSSNKLTNLLSSPITIGGNGSYLESFSFNYENDIWNTVSDATGSYIHQKNLSKNGIASITTNMLSENAKRFTTIANRYLIDSNDELQLVLTSNDSTTPIVECKSCYIKRIPQKTFSKETSNETWEFTCGEITIK